MASLAAGKDKSSNLGRATTFTQEEVEAVSTKAEKAAVGETPAEAQARKKKEAQEEMDREMQELEAKLAQLVSAQDAEQREADMLGAQVCGHSGSSALEMTHLLELATERVCGHG